MDEEVKSDTDEPVLETISPTNETSENLQVDSDSSKQDNANDEVITCYCPTYEFNKCFKHITGAFDEFANKTGDNYTIGCKWAPDGTCLLTSSADNSLRIFNLPMQLHCKETWIDETIPEMKAVLKMREGGLIYDYCWYPPMSSWYPETCCLISTSKDSPVHLWNAYTGNLCGSYIPMNQMEEIVSAYSVAFSYSGDKIYCGFCNLIRVFDTSRPGNVSETRVLQVAPSDLHHRQTGIVSCFAMHPTNEKIYAAGNYLKSIGIYAEPEGSHLAQLTGQIGGVTYLRFSPDGTKLYSGGRKDPYINCWDMRKLGQVLFLMERDVETNQRITFDLSPDGRFFFSGSTSGKVKIWDLTNTPVSWDSKDGPLLQVATEIQASKDCVNGISVHQQYPILASSSGQWHFKEPISDSEEENDSEEKEPEQESTKNENILSSSVDKESISVEEISEKPKEVQTSHVCKKSRPLLRSKNTELIDNSVKLWWIGK